jgi:hypothetical protein
VKGIVCLALLPPTGSLLSSFRYFRSPFRAIENNACPQHTRTHRGRGEEERVPTYCLLHSGGDNAAAKKKKKTSFLSSPFSVIWVTTQTEILTLKKKQKLLSFLKKQNNKNKNRNTHTHTHASETLFKDIFYLR